eukprot:CAMPEP_0197621836 /NCGR_PEP_ID=MMETSP1338-20131121/2275_1 /TAXON_ID=43686 ORGANISM="Pelagodinium beii, Strain RCC1491" /NCGR_SAMPLE_ID=MMETSP1338 /ASSEMBLY_ACC=CAM_ASM_000754 /LENGTH=1093 /DNA_ID=CAMNT_0043191385 /DNA_START=80 /DNA_END=3361 /DNA_ORIENTATION=-
MPPAEESSLVGQGGQIGQRTADPGHMSTSQVEEWATEVDDVTAKINGIIDGSITDFDALDRQMDLKARTKQIREEEAKARKERFLLNGCEGKGEGERYKWWCKRCFVEYFIDLPEHQCTRCKKSDQMMTQQERRAELMDKVEVFKEDKARHQWRKDKWSRWKKSQALLKRSRYINYKAWEYWEPDTDTEDEGEPIVPRDNPEFMAMEADMKDRKKKQSDKAKTAEKCRQRGNQSMKEGDFVGAIEHYDEGLEYRRDSKALWTNKALAELKVFRWHDAINSCNKVIEYSEIFEDGFTKSADACFKAFTRRAQALRALHKWDEALHDLEDAVKLFPKDKEARDLRDKTKAAFEEATKAKTLQDGGAVSPKEDEGVTEEVQNPSPQPSGPVRVEIEESDEEDDSAAELLASASAPGSVAGMSKQDFAKLLKDLKDSEAQRVLFCVRKGGDLINSPAVKADQWVGRKVDLKQVEEVAEPSRLDNLLKDAERCLVLWKKRTPDANGRRAMQDDEPEAKEADAYVSMVTPRVLGILHILATSSDHHCALTAPSVRSIFPLLSSEKWRYDIMLLLMEWSQRSITARSMAEFAGRYPEMVKLLIDLAAEDSKDSILPPGLEDRAKKAADRFEHGKAGLESAMEDVIQGLMAQSPVELAVSTLGNICLAGTANVQFKEQITPFASELVGALCLHLRPLDWRVCGKAAGALCNVLRVGDVMAQTVQEQCTKPLLTALREENESEGPAAKMKDLMSQMGAGDLQNTGLPIQSSSARLLGALLNLVVVRPTAVTEVRDMGGLELMVPLIDPELATFSGGSSGSTASLSDREDGPEVVALRAALVASRLLTSAHASMTQELEADLLRKLYKLFDKIKFADLRQGAKALAAGEIEKLPALEWLDPAVRMLVTVLTKTPGALDRLTQSAPRIEELPDDLDDLPSLKEPAVSFSDLIARLTDIIAALQPREHVGPDQEGSTLSRLRGNLALLFGTLSEVQSKEDAPPSVRNMDLRKCVDVMVDTLRKERGAVQQNVGVCVTRLATNPRYIQQVRDLNGIESLHQIQMPKVQAQKAEEAKKHRLETSVEDRRAEVLRRLKQQQALKPGLD